MKQWLKKTLLNGVERLATFPLAISYGIVNPFLPNLGLGLNEAIDKVFRVVHGLEFHSHPAKDFEDKYQISGISQKYKLPEELANKELAKYCKHYFKYLNPEDELGAVLLSGKFMVNKWIEHKSVALKELLLKLDGIIAINPQLGSLEIDRGNIEHVYHSLMGIASGFNVNDINYYNNRDKISENEKSEIECLTKTIPEMEWRPSLPTLREIHGQLSENKQSSAHDVGQESQSSHWRDEIGGSRDGGLARGSERTTPTPRSTTWSGSV